MNLKTPLNAALGIIVELLYAAAILAAAFLICLMLTP
jgi:hypothetical protein